MGNAQQRRRRHRESVRSRSAFAQIQRAISDNTAGDQVAPTLEAYEEAAGESTHHVGRALIARHNRRMLATQTISDRTRQKILTASVPIVHLQAALVDMGAAMSRPPSSAGQEPADQLLWGVDSVAGACRLLLCGQVAGAAGILRGQIENWASAKAVAAGYTKEAQQSDSEFIATAWSALSGYERLGDVTDAEFLFDLPSESGQLDVTAHPSAPHRHIVTSDGRELCPAAIWGELSELLHGRAYGEASLWDANCLDPEVEPEGAVAVTLVADAIRVVLRSLRLSAIGLARMRGNVRAEDVLAAALEDLSERETEFDEAAPDYGDIPSFEPTPPAHFVIPPLMHLAPLTPDEGLAPRVLSSLNDDAARWLGVIRGTRPAGRLYRDDELLSIGISWTRWRSAHSAQAALERERLTLGSRFEPSMLRFRATSWIHVTETISMLSLWEQREEARWSLAVLSSSLRSGWWLWLEDDDRSMAMFRFALEQLARARVWRKNPAKAEKLQTRSTPRDWLRAAGLRKLGPMNKALGDFTHQLPWADLEAGRELLVKMQLGDDVSETPFTARRSAAELITALAAEEAVEATTERSAILGSTVRELLYPSRLLVGATDVEDESAVNRVMEQIWTYRGA